MATLVSPGVDITIIDESFYSSSGPGTVPFIIIATAQDKINSAGTGIADGTKKVNSEKLYLMSSQRELLQTFGDPLFYSASGSQLNGYSLNEYGLLAAHSLLGISNRAYVMRADVDLGQLYPSTTPPSIDPEDGTHWMSTSTTDPALYEWVSASGKWVKQSVFKMSSDDGAEFTEQVGGDPTTVQPINVPSTYKYVMVCSGLTGLENLVMVRNGNYFDWVIDPNLGSFAHATSKDFQFNKVYPSLRFDGVSALQNGDMWFNTQENDYDIKVFQNSVSRYVDVPVNSNINDAALFALFSGMENTPAGTLLGSSGQYLIGDGVSPGASVVRILSWRGEIPARTCTPIAGPFTGSFIISRFVEGDEQLSESINITFTSNSLSEVVTIINATSGSTEHGIVAEYISDEEWVLSSIKGYTLYLSGTLQNDLGTNPGYIFPNPISGFDALQYQATAEPPVQNSANNTYWYNTEFDVDMLVNTGTGTWNEITTPIYVQPDEPSAPAANSYWIDTNDLENYPVIYKRTGSEWVLRDNTDQITPNGVVFADARPSPTFGTDLGVNNGGGVYPDLDADRPDPLLYPSGILLFNTRYSTRNVKQYRTNYEYQGSVIGDRWINVSGNKPDGSPYTGDQAVRRVISVAMQAAIQSNDSIRSEDIFFNIIATPGFPELIDEMVSLNIDRKETAFVLGDTPFTLPSDATSLQAWATNSNSAITNGTDGLLTADENLGVYYPSGVTTNVDGNEVVVPPSHIMLRTLAYNDQVAYQWYAPAGLQRGVVSNATSVGYVDTLTGEFVPVTLNNGQRDTLYTNNINPIRQIPNKGVVVWGQKTRSPVQSAMDRVNVARLVNYIRYQADKIAQPFLFEPNDDVTRKAVKQAYDSFLNELITLRGLDDFLVVCDRTNNTNARIDRNELWVDIAIVPLKAIEFIYIPIRIKNTGEI